MNNGKEQPRSLIAGFLEELAELTAASPGTYAYRGQENADWKVTSAAYRRLEENNGKPTHEDFIRYHEKTLLEPARMNRYGIKEEGHPLSDLELLAELQHYGAATCLTDFTYNFLVALWFACKGAKKEDGKIFILDTNNPRVFRSLEQKDLKCEIRPILRFETRDKKQQSEEATPLSQDPPYWYWSPHGLNRRILKQDGLFVFGQMKVADEHLLKIITIAGQDKNKVLEELKTLGITRESLFKDLPGFAAAHAHNEPLPIEYESESAENYLEAGNKAFQRGEYKDAIANYDRAIELKPDYAGAYHNRGIAKAIMEDYRGTIADYDRTIELKSDDASAYYIRGLAKVNLKDYHDAIKDYSRAIELKSDHAEAYCGLGIVKAKLGHITEARSDLIRAKQLAEKSGNNELIKIIDAALSKLENSSSPSGRGLG